MTALLEWGESLTRRGDGTGKDSGNLLERFWAAVNFDSHDSALDAATTDETYGPRWEEVGDRTPEIFAKSGSSPIIDVSALWSYKTPTSPVLSTIYCSCIDTEPYLNDRKFDASPSKGHVESSNALEIPRPRSKSIKSTPQPPSSARRSPCPAKSSNDHPIRRSTPPAPNSLLALASSFLDNIVKISQSRSGTPRTTIAVSGVGDIQIVESEVFINVIEDEKRAGLPSPSELQDDISLEKLEIPPLSLLSSILAPAEMYDLQSPRMINGPAGCAQELDALSWMSWERQLSNMHATLWH